DLTFVSHGYLADPQHPQAVLALGDRIVVELHESPPPEQILKFAESRGLELVNPVSYLRNGYVFRVTANAKMNALKVANDLQESGAAKTAEVDFLRKFELRARGSGPDEYLDRQWHLRNFGQSGGKLGADVSATEAWTISRGRRDVVVAV